MGFGSGAGGAGIIGSVMCWFGAGGMVGAVGEGELLVPPPAPDVGVSVGLAAAVADVGNVDAGADAVVGMLLTGPGVAAVVWPAVVVGVELGAVTHVRAQHAEFSDCGAAAFIAG
jgi:hypothetical protein